LASRKLRYCSAGHHPAILVAPPDRKPKPLNTANPLVGMLPSRDYAAEETVLPPGSSLYLFSDGVFEVTTADDRQLALQDFIPIIARGSGPAGAEPQRIYREVRALAKPGPLTDDFSIVVLEFP
jgi:serine phosphatase RsbU (regulator of sigma subunit)